MAPPISWPYSLFKSLYVYLPVLRFHSCLSLGKKNNAMEANLVRQKYAVDQINYVTGRGLQENL